MANFKFLPLTLLLLIIASVGSAETLTLTTYYPAPYGAYDRIRLVPRADDLVCNDPNYDGVIFVTDDTSPPTLRFCDGTTAASTTVGAWRQIFDTATPPTYVNLYPSSESFGGSPVEGRVALGLNGLGGEEPEFKLHLEDNGGILATGTFGAGDTLTTAGAGTRFIWYPRKGAIRAGTMEDIVGGYTGEENGWNDANIGSYSVAFGQSTQATNSHAVVGGGLMNQASNSRTFIGGGMYNRAQAQSSAIVGGGCTSATPFDAGNLIVNGATGSIIGSGCSNEIRANGSFSAILSGQSNEAYNTLTAIGGGSSNFTYGYASVIGGGASNRTGAVSALPAASESPYTTIGGGQNNVATGQHSTIAGGSGNTVGANSATVGGGGSNQATSTSSTVSGGANNTASNTGATVGGGGLNIASQQYGTIGGGQANQVQASHGTVAGGQNNNVQGLGTQGFIGGGSGNSVDGQAAVVAGGAGNNAFGQNSAIAGGSGNTASGNNGFVGAGDGNTASGTSAVVVGGSGNTASNTNAFAGGTGMTVSGQNSFGWGNGGTVPNGNTFVILGQDVGIDINNPSERLHVNGNSLLDGELTVNDITTINADTAIDGDLNVTGDITGAAFIYSDSRLKKDVHVIDNAVDQIAKLSGVRFKWIKDDSDSVGLIAQDVEEVFPELVKTNDETGMKSVAYANLVAPLIEAIKEQQKMIEQQAEEIQALKQRLDQMENNAE